MKMYARLVDKLKVSISENPNCVDFKINIYPSLQDSLLELIFVSLGIKFKKEYLSFFYFSDGIKFSWKLKNNKFGGECAILSLLDTLASPMEMYVPEPWLGRIDLVKYDTFESSEQFSKYTVLAIENQEFNALWYWDEDGDKYPLDLSLSNYVEESLKLKGILDWQYFYINLDHLINGKDAWAYGISTSVTLLRMKELESLLQVVFPVEDWSYLSVKIHDFEQWMLR